jgi:hypothetical protein
MWRVEDGQQLLTAAKPPFPALFVAASSASSSHSLSITFVTVAVAVTVTAPVTVTVQWVLRLLPSIRLSDMRARDNSTICSTMAVGHVCMLRNEGLDVFGMSDIVGCMAWQLSIVFSRCRV